MCQVDCLEVLLYRELHLTIHNMQAVQVAEAWGSAGLDTKAKNRSLSSLMLKTGGVTFLAYLIISITGFAGFVLKLQWSFSIVMKLIILFNNVSWYWISVNDEIRKDTDRMLDSVYEIFRNLILHCLED
jgi:hypothetical protein